MSSKNVGRPKVFQTPEILYHQLFKDYIAFCWGNELMPNLSGFCAYLYDERNIKINRQNLYEYYKYTEYSDTLKSI